MNNRIAIIDLGTNTCNSLIAEYDQSKYNILYQGKEIVKLGKKGIDKNLLIEDGLQRAIAALKNHLETIRKYQASGIIALATSAIREAHNRSWFLDEVKQQTGIELEVISGEKEADLIFKGVKLAFSEIENQSLILDIGGGSNEFILTESGNPIWKESFPLGMARIIDQMPPSDPITSLEIQQINNYFERGLDSLWKQVENIKIPCLIGCSGAFDTLVDLIDRTIPGKKIRTKQEVKLDDFLKIYQTLIGSTTGQRMQMKELESIRVEMIVPSVLFMKLVIDRLNIQKIYQTDYALREGVLYELIFS